MFKAKILAALGLTFFLCAPAGATTKVVAAYPYIADLTKQIGRDQVEITTLTSGDWDPHRVVPKPSLLVKLRQAQMLIINGAQLEIGWLPPLMRQAANGRIQPGNPGFLELSGVVALIQKPQNVSRALGDVHPLGNPHFLLDPANMPKMSAAVARKLCQVDPGQCKKFEANRAAFDKRWASASAGWSKRMGKLKGTRVLAYHRLHDYFLQRYGLVLAGTLEPLPGIPPTPQHLAGLVQSAKTQKVKFNLRGVYNPADPSNYVGQQTGLRPVTLPHDVGAVPEARDVFALFESILKRLGV